jgi:hypothetical protein
MAKRGQATPFRELTPRQITFLKHPLTGATITEKSSWEMWRFARSLQMREPNSSAAHGVDCSRERHAARAVRVRP